VARPSDRAEAPDEARPWRFYRTARGRDPVRSYVDGLSRGDQNAVQARLNLTARRQSPVTRVRGDIFAVTSRRHGRAHQILFAFEGADKQVLLGLDAFALTTKRTPPVRLKAAQERLAVWRSRSMVQQLSNVKQRTGANQRLGVAPPTRTLGLGR